VNEALTHEPATRQSGVIVRISGPVVGVSGLESVRLYDVVLVGELGLVGEVIRLTGDQAIVQVYENTDGVHVGKGAVVAAGSVVARAMA
jgi:V/A-type H+-transporting ATPase subunit A